MAEKSFYNIAKVNKLFTVIINNTDSSTLVAKRLDAQSESKFNNVILNNKLNNNLKSIQAFPEIHQKYKYSKYPLYLDNVFLFFTDVIL